MEISIIMWIHVLFTPKFEKQVYLFLSTDNLEQISDYNV